MKYLSIQTFQCGISVSGLATFTGGAEINVLALNGATTSSEASLSLGAHTTLEGGQLILQKGTSQTYAAHLDNYSDQFRVMYGTNTGSTGVALGINLATGQLNLPFYTTTTSFNGTVVGYLAFDSTGKVITTPVPAGGVTSIIAGTGVSVSSSTGNVTVSIGQSVATSATPSFDQVYLTNNGNGTNVKIGDDAWIGDINTSNTFRVMGQQNNANGYIVFGNANTDALGRSGTGNLTYAGSTVWTASTLTNLNQLTNGPGYITAAALAGYVPTSRLITINGVSYDLSADRSWTIATAGYTSKLQHQVKAGVAINKGQAVYVTSADGTNMIVGLASNASEATSSKTMGLLDATVSINGFANVVTEGLLAGLDTSTAGAAGDPVWLGTGGNLIYGLINKPYAPAHLVFIGIVTRKNNSNGEIFVKVQNGFELDELHDVDLKTNLPTAGQLLRYNSDGLWKNWSPNYLTAEADTLATVTGRGATTNTSITVGPDLTVQSDGGSNYTASRLWLNSHNNYRGAGVHMSGVGSTWFAGTPYTDFDGGYVIARTGTSNDVSSAQYSNALLTVKSSGNVGIGTSSPSYKLQVNADGAGLYVLGANTAPYTQTIASFVYGGNGNSINIENQGGKASIQARAGASTMDLLLNPAGSNVGIGTTTTAFKLNVVDTGATYVAQFKGANSTYVVSGDILLAGESGFNARNSVGQLFLGIGPSADAYFAGTSGATALNFSLGGTSRLYVNSSGNVGIGTTSPAYKFQVAGGDIAIDYNRYLRGGGGGDWNLVNLYNGGTGDMEITMLNASWYLRHNANASFAGKIGIGTTNPVSKLHVLLNGNTSGGPTGNVASFQNSSAGNNAYISLFGAYNAEAGIIFTDESEQYKGKIGYDNISEYMYFQTDGSEKVRITAAGNVGIGTTSPATQLTLNKVAGNAMLQLINASESAFSLKTYNSGSGTVQGSVFMQYLDYSSTINGYMAYHRGGGGSDGFLSFGDNGGERVRFANGGNVGIGVTNPSYKLDVNGSFNFVTSGVYLTYNSGVLYHGPTYYQFPSGSYYYLYGRTGMGLIFGSNNAEVGRFDLSGNLGIGTTAPAEKLHVTQNIALGLTGGSIGDTNNILFPTVNGGTHAGVPNGIYYTKKGNWGGQIDIRTSYDWGYSTDNAKISLNGAEGNGITFSTGASALGSTERVRITSDGNVGIGTSTPVAALHTFGTGIVNIVQSSDSVSYTQYYNTSTGGGGTSDGLTVGNNGTDAYVFNRETSNLILGTSNTEAIRITSTQNVGIGTTGPSAKLHVKSSGNSTGTYNLYLTNSSNSTLLYLRDDGAMAHSGPLYQFGVTEIRQGNALYLYNTAETSYSALTQVANDLVFTLSGNVGIGASPQSGFKLDVHGSTVIRGAIYSNLDIIEFSANGNYNIAQSGNTWLAKTSGNVGIGTSSPTTKLDVNGVITATGGNSTNWNTAYGWGNHSSAGYVPQARTLTINGTSYDLSANRSWTIATTTPGGSDTQFQYNSSGSLAGASALTYNSANNRIGVNQASPGYDFDVNGQVRVQDKLRVGNVNSGNGVVHMSSSATINPSATTIVWAQNVSVGMCAFIEYYILNSNSLTDQRAGTIMVTWNQSGTPTIAHTETTTPDIGSTIAVNFTSSLVGSDARINAVNSSANPYTIVMSYKYF